MITHGLTIGHGRKGGKLHPAYNSWRGMMERCSNPKHKDYRSYGGRGIFVCEEWKKPANFFRDMLPHWSLGMTLDRIDVNGNYEKSNCRWIPMSEQSNTRRDVLKFELLGRTWTLKEISKETGIKQDTLWMRLHRGWKLERAFREFLFP